jgi:hypothetical protein
MGHIISLPTDFNDLNVKIGDLVVFGPVKIFYPFFYHEFFQEFGEFEEGPFEVVDVHPVFNATEVLLGERRILIPNDLLKKLYWD